MRYTSHLDLQRTWERTLRRAKLPLAYSQGFNPHPKINIGAALPLGFTGQAELVEVWLEVQVPLEEIETALSRALPPGLAIAQIIEQEENSPKLQKRIQGAAYSAVLRNPPDDLAARVQELLAQPSLKRERRGKEYDLRPLIQSLQVEGAGLVMHVSAAPGATGRPDEVLRALGLAPHQAHIQRTALILR